MLSLTYSLNEVPCSFPTLYDGLARKFVSINFCFFFLFFFFFFQIFFLGGFFLFPVRSLPSILYSVQGMKIIAKINSNTLEDWLCFSKLVMSHPNRDNNTTCRVKTIHISTHRFAAHDRLWVMEAIKLLTCGSHL
jgi:hypothetical protein